MAGPAALALLVFTASALGAALNPPLNGPDEAAHVEVVQAIAMGDTPTGPEARQPRLYYMLAAVPWRVGRTLDPDAPGSDAGAITGISEGALFAARLLSALCGAAVAWLTWSIARRAWPGDRAPLAVAALASLLTLAPGHLFLLSSVNNDPLAVAACAACIWAALPLALETRPARRRWLVCGASCLVAVAVKPTALPVVLALLAAVAWRFRAHWLRRRVTWAVTGMLALGAAAGNLVLLREPPSISPLASLAHFWPQSLVRGPVRFISTGGAQEAFRTWWYGYDYLVRWPRALETPMAAGTLLLLAVSLAGIVLGLRQRTLRVPLVLWLPCLAQAAFVLFRFGFGDVLQIEMGGAAQAKSFFPALAAANAVVAAGVVSAAVALRLPVRASASMTGLWVVGVDAVSLLVTAWQHVRWWQAGLS